MQVVKLLSLFAGVASAAAVAVAPNSVRNGRSRGGVASEQAACSDIGRNAMVRGVSPNTRI